MIIVDVFVPSVDKTYNFSLNEDVKINLVIDEISEMIGQQEHTHLYGGQSELDLVNVRERQFLSKDNTLYDCGIKTGALLMLV